MNVFPLTYPLSYYTPSSEAAFGRDKFFRRYITIPSRVFFFFFCLLIQRSGMRAISIY